MPKIKFQAHPDVLSVAPHPKPAKKFVPDWYKNMAMTDKCPVTMQGGKSHVIDTISTIKKCMPVRDYLTSGYIIPAWVDIKISTDSEGKYQNRSRVPEEFKGSYSIGCEWHGIEQLKGSPLENFIDGEKCLKLVSPWTITTPKGYSTFFTSPFYTEGDITILPAIVDTDLHPTPVNFPCILNSNECFAKRGTPLIQAFPFKRENWDSEVSEVNLKKSSKASFNFTSVLESVYTTDYWQKKRYR